MLFNFRLFPFPELITEMDYRAALIQEETRRSIGWYVLTDGWYWIDVGDTELFRYTQQANTLIQPPRTANDQYVDYFVSRLWEDIFAILPALLEPLPPSLLERLSSIARWNDWLADKDALWEGYDVDEEENEQEAVYLSPLVDEWWHARRLDTAYLLSGPRIWFWSDGTLLHIGWDNRTCLLENTLPAWDAKVGQRVLPVAQFLAELRVFHQGLMDAMATRIALAPTYWTQPRYSDDLVALQDEQQERSTWLDMALLEAQDREETPWQSVLTSISIIEASPAFIAMRTRRKNTNV